MTDSIDWWMTGHFSYHRWSTALLVSLSTQVYQPKERYENKPCSHILVHR